MTPSQLRYEVQTRNTDTHFFDYKTMRFFGDTMRNYGVRDAGDCWELYRKRPVKYGLRTSAYFDKQTFNQVYRKDPA